MPAPDGGETDETAPPFNEGFMFGKRIRVKGAYSSGQSELKSDEVNAVMKQLSVNESTKNHNSNCAEPMTMAERELAAFFSAVTELFGKEQARLSAEDWLHELAAMNDLPRSIETWRRFTVDVSARLARRVNGSENLHARRNSA